MSNEKKYNELFDIFAKYANCYTKELNIVNSFLQECGYEEIPNIAFWANNKLVQINHQFERQGMEMLSEEEYKINIGVLCYGELCNMVDYGENVLSAFAEKIAGIRKRRNYQLDKLYKTGVLGTLYRATIGSKAFSRKLENVYELTNDDKDAIKTYMMVYRKVENDIEKYSLENNVQVCIIKCFVNNNYDEMAKEKNHPFNENNFIKTFEEYFVPQLKKIGLEKKIPKTYVALEYMGEKIKRKEFDFEDNKCVGAYQEALKNFFKEDEIDLDKEFNNKKEMFREMEETGNYTDYFEER